MTMENNAWKKDMDDYKGTTAPPPHFIAGGFMAGTVGTILTYQFLPFPTAAPLIVMLHCMILPALVFFLETHWGVVTRSGATTSNPKTCYSPAGAAATPGLIPFPLIEQNRIHQNQMESFMYFFPTVLAVTAVLMKEDTTDMLVDARIIPTMFLTWTIGRTLYRVGYRSQTNKFYRLIGMAYTLPVYPPAFGYCLYIFIKDVILGH